MKNSLLAYLFFIGANTALAEESQDKTNSISYFGGNGLSAKTAIIINGAENELDGVKAENKWLNDNLPGFKTISQGLIHNSKHTYDRIEVILPSGTTHQIYFDITGFFGKY